MLGGELIQQDGVNLSNWLNTSIENSGHKSKRKPYQRKVNNSSGFAFFTSVKHFLRNERTAGLLPLRRVLWTDGIFLPLRWGLLGSLESGSMQGSSTAFLCRSMISST